MRRVAVIGAGAFGCMAALELSAAGLEVVLIERRPRILQGASANNMNRLHRGYHYPRDLATARQCATGFDRFVREFPQCVRQDFPNAYFIATRGSLTSPEAYRRFLEAAGLACDELDLGTFSPRIQGVSLGVLTDEATYDAAMLARLMEERLARSAVEPHLGTGVRDIVRRGATYALRLDGGDGVVVADAIVNCGYAEINRLTAALGHRVEEHQHEYTLIPVIEWDQAAVGITIMDGPFMDVLPFGMSRRALLYHVRHTVIATVVARQQPPDWSGPDLPRSVAVDPAAVFRRIRDDSVGYIPALANARLIGHLHGPRIVLARRDADDARPSLVRDHGDGYITVFAGKIDHCIGTAERVRELLSSASERDERPVLR